MRKQDPFVQEIFQLHQSGNVDGVLQKIREIMESSDKDLISLLHVLTWPAPTRSDLDFMATFLHNLSITQIYSVGCGTGLLEWLLFMVWANKEETRKNKVGVTGIEIDHRWWSSPYAAPMFLPLVFVDKDFNAQEPFGDVTDLALFCYFNNLKVFLDYLAVFRGKYVAILGPISTTQFCAPGPLELCENSDMPCSSWRKICFRPFGLGGVDHLAIYEKV